MGRLRCAVQTPALGQGANTLSGSAGRAGATVRRISGSGRNGAV